jgi:hypothetical protein
MNQLAATTCPTRRWTKFTLRSFFIFITLVAIVMGWIAYERAESRRELEIAGQLMASGATVLLGDPYFDSPRRRMAPSWWRTWLGNILGLRVWYVDPPSSFAEPALLSDLKNLRGLNLSGTQVCDLTPLAGLTNLRTLTLRDTQVSDLTPIIGLKNLHEIGLTDTPISNLASLAGLTNLQELDVAGTHNHRPHTTCRA